MKRNEILLQRLINKNQALELQAKTFPHQSSQKEDLIVAFNGFSNLHPKAVLIVYNRPTLVVKHPHDLMGERDQLLAA